MISFNVEGVKRNQHYLTYLLCNLKPKVIFLQEIWLPFHEQSTLSSLHPEYSFTISTPDMFQQPEDVLQKAGHVWHGVAVGWRRDLAASICSLESTCDRLSGVRLSLQQRSLLLLSYYAPTAGKDDDYLDSICNLSDFLQQHTSPGDGIIIGADYNCSSKSPVRRQEAWKNVCERFELTTHHPPNPSFHHHNGQSESFLDIFATSSTLALQSIAQHCTLDTPLNLSSHDPIVTGTSVKLYFCKQKSKYSSTYSDFRRQRIFWDKLKLPEYQNMVSEALSSALDSWSTPECIPHLTSLVSKLFVTSATQVFTTRNQKSDNPRKPSLKIRQAQNRLKKAFLAWKNSGKPSSKADPDRAAYAKARAELQSLRRHEENLLTIYQNNYLMNLDRNNRSKMYNFMKRQHGYKNSHSSMTNVLHTPVGSYTNDDILEGFAADTEYLGRSNEGNDNFDQDFYRLCKLDNLYIFDFLCSEPLSVPPMTLAQLNNILDVKMKSGKACDVYQVTVEHLRYCGDQAKLHLLTLINRILHDLQYLACPQVKLGLGTAILKGKKKPISKSSSYRRVTVTPIIGAIIDYYLDPKAEAIFRPSQSPDQLGFTAGVSYLLAAIQRGECQRWAVDQKMTCFGVSLDGQAAFPSVEREIQLRELYSVGERGDILQYSKCTYRNTECHIKLNGKLSRKVVENKGNRQGHVRASGHFKVYINPCLLSLNSSNLGFFLGLLCITSVCVADDAYLLSSTPSGLQSAINTISHYAKRYQLQFNANKTKIVVTGSKIDMAYYKETSPWTLNGERIEVVDNNEHLGLIVAGIDEEVKNIDENIRKCRASLFALLGPAFAYKILMSPKVQIHLWRACSLPVLLSGLPALPVRPAHAKVLKTFHNKVMRGFLKLSQSSPIPALHFLLGEIPIEGLLHIRTLCLFYNIWSNPGLTIFTMTSYILKMCEGNSTTWCNHVNLLCQKYGLPSPLSLLHSTPMSKQSWITLVKTRVITWHERDMRTKSETNSKMKYLNVQVSGLSGRPHPVLENINTTQEAKKLRLHLKFLTCDYLTNERLAKDHPHLSAACELCLDPTDSIEHVLASCRATAEVRNRLFPELVNAIVKVQPMCSLLHYHPPPDILTQFILDCTSLNLPDSVRIPAHNPLTFLICKISRDWCNAISCERLRLLKMLRK